MLRVGGGDPLRRSICGLGASSDELARRRIAPAPPPYYGAVFDERRVRTAGNVSFHRSASSQLLELRLEHRFELMLYGVRLYVDVVQTSEIGVAELANEGIYLGRLPRVGFSQSGQFLYALRRFS